MTSPGSSRTAVRPIAGLRATHRARLRAWWRGPALRRMTRRQANLALVLVGVLCLVRGGGAAAVVQSVVFAPDEVERTALGPVQIHLPDVVGEVDLHRTERRPLHLVRRESDRLHHGRRPAAQREGQDAHQDQRQVGLAPGHAPQSRGAPPGTKPRAVGCPKPGDRPHCRTAGPGRGHGKHGSRSPPITPQGHCVVGFLLVTRVMAWSGWRAWWRRARAMLVWPASRRRLMIRLRQTARAWGPAPVLAWWRSS